jgi:hypothetical protein
MNRLYEIFKTPSGPSTGKAQLNHTIFSPSQTGETVPLKFIKYSVDAIDDVSHLNVLENDIPFLLRQVGEGGCPFQQCQKIHLDIFQPFLFIPTTTWYSLTLTLTGWVTLNIPFFDDKLQKTT